MNVLAKIQNRIVAYGTKAADQFEPNPLNWRIHPQRQRDAVSAALRELGWIGVVVENVTTGHLIDGHERVWQALATNDDVPFIQVELTEEEERLALATFHPLGALAEPDADAYALLVAGMTTAEDALNRLLADVPPLGIDPASADLLGFLNGIGDADGDDGHSNGGSPGSAAAMGSADSPYVQLSFACDTEQRTRVLAAVNAAKKQFGLATSTDAIVQICDLFMGE